MNKKITFFTFAAVLMAFSFLFVSCPSGLEPSWKNSDKPVFSLDFSSSLQGEQGSARALVQGGGFLYIRTIGSPSGPAGKFYGPFRISSGIFSTTEIPAGTYASIAVIYAAEEADSEKRVYWNNTPYSFLELMKLSDADFMETIGSETEEFDIEKFFNSNASGNMTKDPVTIVAGRENTVGITLEPFVNKETNVFRFEQSYASLQLVNDDSTLKKQFFALENAPSGLLSFEVYAESTPAPIIGKTALYDKKGKLLKSWASGTNTGEFALPNHSKDERLYFYIEYPGTFELHFFVEPIVEPEGSVTFSGDEQTANKPFLFLLFENPPLEESSLPDAFGYISLDSSGLGVGTPLATGGGSYTITPNKTYYVMGFVDINGNYPTFPENPSESFEPINGDLVFSNNNGMLSINSSEAGLIEIKNPTLIPFGEEPSQTEGSVAFSGGEQTANKAVLFFLFENPPQGEASPSDAFGYISINGDGLGSAAPLAIGGGSYTVEANKTYYVMGFVDMSGRYPTFPEEPSALFEPINGDLVFPDNGGVLMVNSNAASVISVNNPTFLTLEDFPSQTGGSVLFTGFPGYEGCSIYMTVFDSTGDYVLGRGIGIIDVTGLAQIATKNSDGFDFQFDSGDYYQIAAFVDSKRIYSDITDPLTYYANSNEIVPHFEDPTTYSPYSGGGAEALAVSSEIALTFSSDDMPLSTTAVYFVADVEPYSNNGGTRVVNDALDFLTALEKTNDIPYLTDKYVIYISENVTYTVISAGPQITKNIKIKSLGSTQHVISLSSIDGGVPFQINSEGILSLENLVIDGKNIDGWVPGFNVEGRLEITDTTIRNIKNGEGGGGGICINNAGIMTIDSRFLTSTISGNTVGYGGGGGIYIVNGGTLEILSANYLITGNTALNGDGAGVYCEYGGFINDLGSPTLDDNCKNNTAGPLSSFPNVYIAEP